MIDLILQLWGGSFYLLNKIFFSKAERSDSYAYQMKYRMRAWSYYLLGLPPWVLIFIAERNWIAAAVESSGVPSMLIGLRAAWQGQTRQHEQIWLDHLAKLMILVGLGLSFYDFGGLVSLNQFLELGIAAGFLMGTYLLAKTNPLGYLWLMAGNICAALLMLRQGYFILMTQQFASLIVVIDAYWNQRCRGKQHET